MISTATQPSGLYVPVHKRTGSHGSSSGAEDWRATITTSANDSPQASPKKSVFPSVFGGSTESVNTISESHHQPTLPIYTRESLLSLGQSHIVGDLSSRIQESIKESTPEILMTDEHRQQVKQLENSKRRRRTRKHNHSHNTPLSTQTAAIINAPAPAPAPAPVQKEESKDVVVQVTPRRQQNHRMKRTSSRRKLMEEASWRRGVVRRTSLLVLQAQ